MSKMAAGKVTLYAEISPKVRTQLDELACRMGMKRNEALEFAIGLASNKQPQPDAGWRELQVKINELWEDT
jgi:hypothetical protein